MVERHTNTTGHLIRVVQTVPLGAEQSFHLLPRLEIPTTPYPAKSSRHKVAT